jgi:hypothetical protein
MTNVSDDRALTLAEIPVPTPLPLLRIAIADDDPDSLKLFKVQERCRPRDEVPGRRRPPRNGPGRASL